MTETAKRIAGWRSYFDGVEGALVWQHEDGTRVVPTGSIMARVYRVDKDGALLIEASFSDPQNAIIECNKRRAETA